MEKQTPARAEREVGALEIVGELRVAAELAREIFQEFYTLEPLFRREERFVGVVYFWAIQVPSSRPGTSFPGPLGSHTS